MTVFQGFGRRQAQHFKLCPPRSPVRAEKDESNDRLLRLHVARKRQGTILRSLAGNKRPTSAAAAMMTRHQRQLMQGELFERDIFHGTLLQRPPTGARK